MAKNLQRILTRGIEAIYPSKEAFSKALQTRKLTIYHGIDPTAPSLHLGHLVVLRKLRQLQDLGHKIILLIGDFTATIGDPSGKLSARKAQTKNQVLANAKDYQNQAGKILRFTGTNAAEIKFNSNWLSKLSFGEILKLASNFTVQQLLERDMFQERMVSGKPIFLPELIYPLLQGYDSVAMKVDTEIGGTDQTFNMLIGRELMKKYLAKEKFVVTTKLLTVGKVKMGKTESVFIPLSLDTSDMFGKIMALPDTAMQSFFELLTDLNGKEWKNLKPIEAKKLLAREILSQLFSPSEVRQAQKEFEIVFQQKELPKAAPVFSPKGKNYRILDLLVETKFAKSRAEAKRLLREGAVESNQIKIFNPQTTIASGATISVGPHRFVKVK